MADRIAKKRGSTVRKGLAVLAVAVALLANGTASAQGDPADLINQAINMRIAGQADDARRLLGDAITAADAADLTDLVSLAYLVLGEVEAELGTTEAARQAYQTALETVRRVGDGRVEASVLMSIGRLEFEQGGLRKALNAFAAANTLYAENNDVAGGARAMLGVATAGSPGLPTGPSESNLNTALRLAKSAGHEVVEGRILIALGELAFADGAYDRALSYHDDALDLFLSLQFLAGMGEAALLYARVETARGNYDTARDAVSGTLGLYEQEADERGQARAWLAMGDLESALGNIDAARDAYFNAGVTAQGVKDRHGEALALLGFGRTERARERFDEAGNAYLRAESLFEATEDILGFTRASTGLGNVLVDVGRYDDARLVYTKTREISVLSQDRLGEVSAFAAEASAVAGLGRLEVALGNMPVALAQFDAAVELFEKAGLTAEADDLRRTVEDIGRQ